MSGHEYDAHIVWRDDGAGFAEGRYSRAHEWRFDGGTVVPASASPSVVPPPRSRPDAVDPEEAFVAALSSCHMLWFLDFARRAGFAVAAYEDRAAGVMQRVARGRMAITRVTLRPQAVFVGRAPGPSELSALHDKAHEACFIANSVTSEVVVEPLATIVEGI